MFKCLSTPPSGVSCDSSSMSDGTPVRPIGDASGVADTLRTPAAAPEIDPALEMTEEKPILSRPEPQTMPPPQSGFGEHDDGKVSAYARLDFDNFTFYVQTLQVVLGRRPANGSSNVDVHLGTAKAISRRHAKIFYNFATQRFELTVLGRNGAFVGDMFVEADSTVPLKDKAKIQIGQIAFTFNLPNSDADDAKSEEATPNQDSAQMQPPKEKRKPRREYKPEEIPPEYREKPAHSYSHLITESLRGHPQGLSLADIYEAIMDLFPYYRYCQPGWQNSVRHNLSSSKSFRKVSKEGKGWLWGLDEDYLAEKERQKQRAVLRHQQQQQEAVQRQQKSIAEMATEIPSRPGLSQETVKLLAGLQHQVQYSLEKAGQPPINNTVLSNALAVVIAQAAKQHGGLSNLSELLNDSQAVRNLLVQALELLRRQGQTSHAQSQAQAQSSVVGVQSGLQSADGGSVPSHTAPQQAVAPPPSVVGAESTEPENSSVQNASGQTSPKDRSPAQESKPRTQSSGASDSSQSSQKKMSPEKIAELLAQAEKIPNPPPHVRNLIEQLRAHQQRLGYATSAPAKRPASEELPPPKPPSQAPNEGHTDRPQTEG